MQKKYYKKRSARHPKRKIIQGKIRPGSDPLLKKIFQSIGVPEEKPFEPDPFQLEAIDAIERSDCLVTAPTGAGKTWIAEKAVSRILSKEGKAWYATPLKALTNGIYSHFCEVFGAGYVGILTGDRKENTEAPVIIGTTEILRNHLYDAMEKGEDLDADLVILDEAHFLGDESRGVVWEEIMIYLPTRIPLLMLSATIGNANQIAGWLESIRSKKCLIVNEEERPVPLHHLFFHPSGTLLPLVKNREQNKKAVLDKKVLSYIQSDNPPLLSPPQKLPPMGDIIRVLRKFKLLPAIFFLKSRMDCNNALELCTGEGLANDPERKAKLSKRIEELHSQSSHLSGHKQLWHLEHLAVGSHHSGQLPSWKIVVETLMSEGLLDAVFATSTVAAGVNFPARTVVILNSDRYNGTEFLSLNPTEFHQMTGRCGRRGKDNVGFSVVLPGRFMDLRLVSKLIEAPPSHIHSQIRINFSMVLNLLLSHTPGQIAEMLEKSFATYLISKKSNKKKTLNFFDESNSYLWRDFLQHLNFLKDNNYASEDDILTDDGVWASKLRIDQPLIVAEGFRLGLFPESDPALLAGIIASFVNEKDSKDENLNYEHIPKELVSVFLNIKKRLRPFTKSMSSKGFGFKSLYLRPAVTIHAWASGMPWEKVLSMSEIAEGDLARLILRTSDNLMHIRNLSDVFPEAARNAGYAIELIKREPVITLFE